MSASHRVTSLRQPREIIRSKINFPWVLRHVHWHITNSEEEPAVDMGVALKME